MSFGGCLHGLETPLMALSGLHLERSDCLNEPSRFVTSSELNVIVFGQTLLERCLMDCWSSTVISTSRALYSDGEHRRPHCSAIIKGRRKSKIRTLQSRFDHQAWHRVVRGSGIENIQEEQADWLLSSDFQSRSLRSSRSCSRGITLWNIWTYRKWCITFLDCHQLLTKWSRSFTAVIVNVGYELLNYRSIAQGLHVCV